jgi:hypothetical protein
MKPHDQHTLLTEFTAKRGEKTHMNKQSKNIGHLKQTRMKKNREDWEGQEK